VLMTAVALCNHKVFKAVIKWIPVDMVDNLIKPQGSAERLLHDIAVLGDAPSIDVDDAITEYDTAAFPVIGIGAAHTLPSTRKTAKLRSLVERVKGLPALLADVGKAFDSFACHTYILAQQYHSVNGGQVTKC